MQDSQISLLLFRKLTHVPQFEIPQALLLRLQLLAFHFYLPVQEIGGINLYGFVNNSPLQWIDPYGLDWDSYGAWIRNLFKKLWQRITGDAGKKTLNYDGTFTTKLDDNNGINLPYPSNGGVTISGTYDGISGSLSVTPNPNPNDPNILNTSPVSVSGSKKW